MTTLRTAVSVAILAIAAPAAQLSSQALAAGPDSSVRAPLPRGATIGDAAFQRVEEELDWAELDWAQLIQAGRRAEGEA